MQMIRCPTSPLPPARSPSPPSEATAQYLQASLDKVQRVRARQADHAADAAGDGVTQRCEFRHFNEMHHPILNSDSLLFPHSQQPWLVRRKTRIAHRVARGGLAGVAQIGGVKDGHVAAGKFWRGKRRRARVV